MQKKRRTFGQEERKAKARIGRNLVIFLSGSQQSEEGRLRRPDIYSGGVFLNKKTGILDRFNSFRLLGGEVHIETALQFSDQQQKVNGIEVEVILQMGIRMNVLNRHIEPPTDEVDDTLLHVSKC